MELVWYHGQTRVSLTDDSRYRIDSDNCLYRLVIMGVTVSDAGDWRCLATNSYGQCISACRLDVVGTSPCTASVVYARSRGRFTPIHCTY